MDPKKLLNADYLDIVFDNRNKAYGGYELRKNYSRRVKKGVSFLMLGLASIVSFSFIHVDKPKAVEPNVVVCTYDLKDVKNIDPPKPKEVLPPPPPAPPAPSTKFTELKVTDDKDIKPDDALTNVHDITNPGTKTVDTGSGENPPIASTGTGTGPVVPTPAKAEIVTFVEQMPTFNGELLSYLAKNIVYPPAAREAGIQGRVGVEFIVNEDGSITDARIVRSIGGGCDEEALRVIKAMPKWKAGRQNGTAVKVRFTQAILFKLD